MTFPGLPTSKRTLSDACVREVDRFGGGSVMVWGGISFNSRTQLIIFNGNLTGQRYRDEILAPVEVPHFNVNRNVTIFQKDNARCHTARVSVDYLQQQNIDLLPWSARSPDLSPIEHLWDALDRRALDNVSHRLWVSCLIFWWRNGTESLSSRLEYWLTPCDVVVWQCETLTEAIQIIIIIL